MSAPDPPIDLSGRYQKQVLFDGIGSEGQERLKQGRALVVGCGALGSVIADQLVRAGVGFVRIVDRDYVEVSNLQRQVLYDESDVASHLPKAIAAANKLQRINSDVTIEPIVADVGPDNVLELVEGVDVIVDGTDNFEVRFLINDASLETGVPWINGGCVGSHGQVMTILPGRTACLRCLIEREPEPGSTETCDTAGVIGPAVNVVSSLEVVDALKLLVGREDLIEPVLTVVDVWDGTWRRLKLGDLRERANCRACQQGRRDWLNGERSSRSTALCGRNAVQVTPAERTTLSLEQLESRLTGTGEICRNPYLLRLTLAEPQCQITVFRDGRAIIKGTEDVTLARSLYARYVGN